MSRTDPTPPTLDTVGLLGRTAGQEEQGDVEELELDDWLQRARSAYRASTDWFDAVIRPQVQRNIAHFKNRHAPGSKYYHTMFKARSQLFRPKTRSLIRRSEAAAAVALFSTADVLDVKPWSERDVEASERAKVAQSVLQHRLEEHIPWFLTACGAMQDAAVTGVCIGHTYWNHKAVDIPEIEVSRVDGKLDIREVTTRHVVANRPEIDLVPLENFRIDPAADWRDPVNSSPYTIHSVPTYVGDLRGMIQDYGRSDVLDESRLWAATEEDHDSIRTARESVAIEKYDDRQNVDDARTVWVRKHTHRIGGIDYYFETINDLLILREPEQLRTAFPHVRRMNDRRPYVMGFTVLETHRAYKDSAAQLVHELQQEANDIVNLRLDQAKNAMFGRWKVLRGRNVDTQTLLAGIPQSVISVDNMDNLQELRQSDVGQGAFSSEDRVNTDFDEVSGNFSLASITSNREMNETVGGMNLLSSDASQVKEYEIRMLVETWVEPVMRQLLALEAEHEDDEEVLGIVARDKGITPAEVQDALEQPLKLKVNVGFNATSPEKRIGRLMLCLNAVSQAAVAVQNVPGANMGEIFKEIFGAAGFKDGGRFMPGDGMQQDPEKEMLRQQVAQLQQMLDGKLMETQSRERIAQGNNESRERIAVLSTRVQFQVALLAHGIANKKTQLEEVDRMLAAEDTEIRRGELRLQREALSHEINEANKEVDRLMQENKAAKALKGAAGGKDKGPPKLEGDDKAGVIARDRFGDVPHAQG